MPGYQLLPELTEDEYQTLKATIKERGVQLPIIFDEEGNTLDGHHRLRACEELGITDYPREIKSFSSEDEKYAYVLELNLARRHLTPEQKQELVGKIHAEQPSWSVRRIASVTGIPRSSVQRYLTEHTFVPSGTPGDLTAQEARELTDSIRAELNKLRTYHRTYPKLYEKLAEELGLPDFDED